MNVAVLFDNFGPYHHARVSALASRCEVLPIEVCARSASYQWGALPERRVAPVTLVAEDEVGRLSSRDVDARLRSLLDRKRPDVIAVPGWHGSISMAAIGWALEARRPVIMMSETTRGDAPRAAHREFLKRQVVALCSGALVGGLPHRAYVAELGIQDELVMDGYDVVDNEYFRTHTAAARSSAGAHRAALDLPNAFFLASSRFIDRKNLSGLVDAYGLYRRRAGETPWDLVILGYGAGEQALRAHIARAGLTRVVHIRRSVPYERLPLYYGLAGAFIHPALVEPWGLVVNEAMAAGVPALVSNTAGCFADLVIEGETGLGFDPSDTAALSRLLLEVSADGTLRQRLASAAALHIRSWSPERFGDHLALLARRVLSTRYFTPRVMPRIWLHTLRHAS